MHRNKRSQRKPRGRKTKYAPQVLKSKRSAARVGPIASADETDVRLKFVDNSYMNNAVGGQSSKEYTPNAAYDVDPSLGSTATNAFDAYALLYSYYRVISYRYKIDVVNRDEETVNVYCYNTNTAVSGSSLDVYAGNPYCATALLGPASSGSNKHVFRGSVMCSKLLGSIEAETDATTRALVTGVPTDLLFLSIFASSTGATLPKGVAYITSITMDVRFYGRVYNAFLGLSATQDRMNQLVQSRIEYLRKKEELSQKKNVKA